ncbi:MAG TPA: type II toxin-antitoxin system RelE/ParE family toxin [Thermodesulfobacteriota bacterium]|nr:type II toxin-antitoxin system RelE/ParE family toxin [Thermodesulfobacteriota bacterium]
MAYNILYKESVQRDLRRLSKAEAQRVLKQIEEELSKNADTYPVLKGRFKGLRKHRIGDYRVIYAILENEVLVLRIGHRKQVYKGKI